MTISHGQLKNNQPKYAECPLVTLRCSCSTQKHGTACKFTASAAPRTARVALLQCCQHLYRRESVPVTSVQLVPELGVPGSPSLMFCVWRTCRQQWQRKEGRFSAHVLVTTYVHAYTVINIQAYGSTLPAHS